MRNNLKIIGILILLLVAVKSLPFLPWWAFTVFLLMTGIVIARINARQSCFLPGFIAGFMVWTGALLFYNNTFGGTILARTGPGLYLIPVFSGLAGGVLSGLALYTGKMSWLSLNR